jgi:hypothetical protein
VVDDLHHDPGVDPGEVAQELEPEGRLVMERGQHRNDVAGPDPDLGLVVTLSDRAGQLLAEAGIQARLELAVHA